LPTEDVYFYNAKIPGEGYPFDNLQISAVWVGTPVYIIGETRDHVWMLVVTPEYIAWVKSRGIARTNNTFVNTWSFAAKNKLAAITRQKTSILDENRTFLFTAYMGSVFPVNTMFSNLQLMVPVADINHNAIIKNSVVSSNEAVLMPLTATPHHFSNIMNALIDRPYGWGGMYLYNDCSSELKSLFTPFGIWLPRYSGDQGDAGKIVDMSSESPSNRLSYLMENGQPFLTIIYIGGHVFLYMGNYSNPHHDSSKMAMTYQNMWGLKPNPDVRRAVIGKSVLFPLLLQYPEDESLVSLANKKYFHVIYLNELPHANLFLKERAVNLPSLMNYHEK
jgi:cell wall-associated NlpC family hydrolase